MAKQLTPSPIRAHGWLRVLIFLAVYLVVLTGIVRLGLETYTLFSVSTAAGVVLVWLCRRLLDGEALMTLGLQWKGAELHAATGFLAAVALLGTGTCILVAMGELEWLDYGFNGRSFFMSMVIMAMVAFSEELIFRGYLLTNLRQQMPGHIALLVSAGLFAIFHGANPNTSWLALVNIFIAGILLGINYVFTNNLWFGIALHFAWNFFQGPVLGYAVSGLELPSVLVQNTPGEALLTGGKFGFEASVLYTLLALLLTGVLWYVYQRRYR